MDIKNIECFLSAAKCLNFSRAAKEQFVAQSTMTAQINSLEEELGIQLFKRDKRNVYLTPAGEYLYHELTIMYQHYKSIKAHIGDFADQQNKILRVGYHGPVEWASLYEIINNFNVVYPNVSVEVDVGGWGILTDKILNRDLDVALIAESEVESIPQLETEFLFKDYGCVAVNIEHPLSKRESILPEELIHEKIIMTGNKLAPRSLANIHKDLEYDGFPIWKFVDQFDIALAMVAVKQGITLLPRTFKSKNDTLVYIDLQSTWYLNINIVWLKENEKDIMKNFIQFLKSYYW